MRKAEERVLSELELVGRTLRVAAEAATSEDAAAATRTSQQIEELADEAQRRYEEAHDQILALLALQSPVATDLRLAIALLHINDRVERMSAQCVNLATLRAATGDERAPAEQLRCLSEMAALAGDQVESAARAFAERDAEAASRLREQDHEVNERNRHCFALAVRASAPGQREAALFVALMARALERIGDNAVDVAQQTEFALTGRLRPPSRQHEVVGDK